MSFFSITALKVCAAVILVALSGISAGLEVALFSIDSVFLRVWSAAGTEEQKCLATKLLFFFNQYHFTLVSLILFNSSCMMSLPIVLDTLVSPMTSLILSITVVLFIGEVIPLAFFVRHSVFICAFFSPLIKASIIITSPISYPVSLLLDYILGLHEELLDRDELAALILPVEFSADNTDERRDNTDTVTISDMPTKHVKMHPMYQIPMNGFVDPLTFPSSSREDERQLGEENDEENSHSVVHSSASATGNFRSVKTEEEDAYRLRKEEVQMLKGAMQLSKATVMNHMRTKTEHIFMLSSQQRLDAATVASIIQSGFSRIPIYFGDNPRHVIGVLIVNSLVKLCFASPDPPPLLANYPLREVMRLSESATLYDAYLAFREGSSNMAVIYNSIGIMVGLLTLTDVLSTLYLESPSIEDASGNYVIQRRANKMVGLVESMKFLSQSKHINTSFLSRESEKEMAQEITIDNIRNSQTE